MRTRYVKFLDKTFVLSMLAWLVASLATIPFRHLFDVDISCFISAMLMIPEFILKWFQSVSLVPFINKFILPMLVLCLFIMIVVKIKPPSKKE